MTESIYKNMNDMTTCFNYYSNKKYSWLSFKQNCVYCQNQTGIGREIEVLINVFTSCNLQNLRRFEFDFDSKSILFAVA